MKILHIQGQSRDFARTEIIHIMEKLPFLLKKMANRCDPWRFHAEMWKVANSARLKMRPRGTGNQPDIKRRGKMKDRQTYRTNFLISAIN